MSMQDTGSGVALWRQVADGIERGIADGTFAAGEKLPGENRDRRNLPGQPPYRAPGAGDARRTRLRARRARQRHLCRGAATGLSAALADAVFRDRRRRRPRTGRPADRRITEPATRELARQLNLKIEPAGADRDAAAGRQDADLRRHHLARRGTFSRGRARSMSGCAR